MAFTNTLAYSLEESVQGTLTKGEGFSTVDLLELVSLDRLLYIEDIINLCY